jgi:hypothetical protein
MRLWTLLSIVIGFVAQVTAIVLLLGGYDAATLLVTIALGAAVMTGAGMLLVTKPPPAAQFSADSPVSSSVISPECSVTSPAAELEDDELPDGDPLDNLPWLKLIEENVALFDELDSHRADFDAPRQELADHVICRLQEILERCGVEPISGEGDFDRSRHQNEGAVRVFPGAMIAETLSPGFRIGKRILRRARVRIQTPAPAPPS